MNVPAGSYYYHECICWCIYYCERTYLWLLLPWMYLLVHITTMNVPAGAYYYHECTCRCILLPWMYLPVHIITLNVPAVAYYYHECICQCILLPWMYLLVHIITMHVPQTWSTAVKHTLNYPTEKFSCVRPQFSTNIIPSHPIPSHVINVHIVLLIWFPTWKNLLPKKHKKFITQYFFVHFTYAFAPEFWTVSHWFILRPLHLTVYW